MSKEPMRDMFPSGKRSVRRIGISRSRRKSRPRIQQEDNSITPSRGRRSWKVWSIAVLIILILFFIFGSLLFSGADVMVTPHQEVVTLDGTFPARQGAEFGELPYEIVTIEREAAREVVARGEEQVERKASGTITIYNAYDESSQRFIKNTRFESPEGLIYRIPESVVVPGATKKSDGTLAPGSLQVTVFAETSGSEYNTKGPVRFTLPALEKSYPELFNTIHAELAVGSALSGGFSGMAKVVSPDDKTLAEAELEAELRLTLLEAARTEVPGNFVLFDEATLTYFETLPVESGEGDNALVKVRGTLYGLIFNEADLAEHIALQTIADYDRAPVRVSDPEVLTVTLPDKETLVGGALERADVAISGTPRLVWQFDEETLKKDLLGVRKEATRAIFSGYPAIESAEVVVRPFWKRTLPTDPEEILITVVLGE